MAPSATNNFWESIGLGAVSKTSEQKTPKEKKCSKNNCKNICLPMVSLLISICVYQCWPRLKFAVAFINV